MACACKNKKKKYANEEEEIIIRVPQKKKLTQIFLSPLAGW